MKCINHIGSLCLFVYWVSIEQVHSNNYGSPIQYLYFPRAASIAEPVKTAVAPKDERPQVIQSARRLGGAYTIFYPLTFQSRGGKNLNLTLLPPFPAQEDQVQSRIMNKPEPYPNFVLDNFPKYDRVVEGIYPALPPAQDCDHSKDPPPSNAYVPKSPFPPLPAQPPTKTYGDKFPSPRQPSKYVAQVPPLPTPSSKYTDKHSPNKAPKANPAQPVVGYNKNTVPKSKTPPLQIYNKATAAVVPQPYAYKIQQWSSCICVPFYLCKDGVINSGGRLQTIQRRTARSFRNRFGNITTLASQDQSKVVNAYAENQDSEASVCTPDKVCCQVNFADNVEDIDDGNYYPVATPVPEPDYPLPPRHPSKGYNVCGVRPAFGVQGRLKHLRYTSDVSEFGEYPWQVAILKKVVNDKNLYLCGGVLISPQWVATVAHCIKKEKSSPLLIRLGEWDVNRKDEAYPYVENDVVSIVIHPDFDEESLNNDLALIKMKDVVDSRIPHITPACLPKPGVVYEDQKCWVSGWGKDFFGSQGEYQNVLKEVDVPVVTRSLCNTELRSTNLGPSFVLHPGFLCAGGEAGKDACTGDGGSPLVCQGNGLWYVVGLVSWGIGCGQPGVPGVYVNLLYYIDWINSIIWR